MTWSPVETPADRVRERAIADRLEVACGWELHRFPANHSIDYFAEHDGFLVANVEIKTRRDRWDPVMIDLEKYLALMASRILTPGAMPLFVVAYSAPVPWCGWVDLSRVEPIGARPRVVDGPLTARSTQTKRQATVSIPLTAFTQLP